MTDADTLRSHVSEAVEALRPRIGSDARVGLILGTGLGRLADEIEVAESIPYSEIPHFPLSTVESHDGRLLAGTLRGRAGRGRCRGASISTRATAPSR